MKPTLAAEIRWPKRVRTASDAVRFIDAVGYCLLFPVKNVPLPSLYYAAARRDISLGPQWDKYCQLIWEWKDDLPKRGRAFYAKYFRGRGSFISLKLLPQFLALHGTTARVEEAEQFYTAGRISHDARSIWQALAAHGPLATLELRHACKMDSKAGNPHFKRAMLELQRLLLVVHFGAAQETAAWPSGRFELTARAFPGALVAARESTPTQARAILAAKYLHWHPNASPAVLARLFGWKKAEAEEAVSSTRPP